MKEQVKDEAKNTINDNVPMLTLSKVSNKISALKAAATSSSSKLNIKTAITSIENKKVKVPSSERKIDKIKFWNSYTTKKKFDVFKGWKVIIYFLFAFI